jgi:hypothetical protein
MNYKPTIDECRKLLEIQSDHLDDFYKEKSKYEILGHNSPNYNPQISKYSSIIDAVESKIGQMRSGLSYRRLLTNDNIDDENIRNVILKCIVRESSDLWTLLIPT